MERAFLSAELREVRPVEVNFSNWLELSGVRLTRDAVGILLALRWRALRKSHRPWRCFAHVVSEGRQVTSLDHKILGGRPPVGEWEAGDEGFERLRLWMTDPWRELRVRLGVYDPGINVRAAVLASTLAVADDSSAVWVETDEAPAAGYTMKFEAPPLRPCRVVFERGVELTAYSVARENSMAWLRLKWTLRPGIRRGVRFFGHGVAEQAAEIGGTVQFDQDLALERRGPATAEEQNIVRGAGGPLPRWLRAGLFRPSNGSRLKIEASEAAFDERYRCVYLDLERGGA